MNTFMETQIYPCVHQIQKSLEESEWCQSSFCIGIWDCHDLHDTTSLDSTRK